MAETEPTVRPALRATAEEAGPVLRVVVGRGAGGARAARLRPRPTATSARRASVKGFRPGKVPRSVLERLYGAMLLEDVERALVAETLPEAVEQVGVEPVAEPAIESGPPAPDAPFRYTARIEVKPQDRAARPDGPLGPAAGGAGGGGGGRARARGAAPAPRAARRPARPRRRSRTGHYVTLDYVGPGRRQALRRRERAGRAPSRWARASSRRASTRRSTACARATTREIAVALPADSGWGEAAGHDATFAVHVVAVKHRPLPALDDAFAGEVGGFESVDGAPRAHPQRDPRGARARGARAAARDAHGRRAAGASSSRCRPASPSAVSRRGSSWPTASSRARCPTTRSTRGSTPGARSGGRRWSASCARSSCSRRVGAARGLAPDEDAVTARIDELAREQGIDARRLRKSYDERGMRGALAAQMLRERALDGLIEQAPSSRSLRPSPREGARDGAGAAAGAR